MQGLVPAVRLHTAVTVDLPAEACLSVIGLVDG